MCEGGGGNAGRRRGGEMGEDTHTHTVKREGVSPMIHHAQSEARNFEAIRNLLSPQGQMACRSDRVRDSRVATAQSVRAGATANLSPSLGM